MGPCRKTPGIMGVLPLWNSRAQRLQHLYLFDSGCQGGTARRRRWCWHKIKRVPLGCRRGFRHQTHADATATRNRFRCGRFSRGRYTGSPQTRHCIIQSPRRIHRKRCRFGIRSWIGWPAHRYQRIDIAEGLGWRRSGARRGRVYGPQQFLAPDIGIEVNTDAAENETGRRGRP